MLLPKPLYEALPPVYVIAGIVCIYVASGMTLAPALMKLESALLFAAGVILGAAGIAIVCRRYSYRKNGTVFVKYSSEQPRVGSSTEKEMESQRDISTVHE